MEISLTAQPTLGRIPLLLISFPIALSAISLPALPSALVYFVWIPLQ